MLAIPSINSDLFTEPATWVKDNLDDIAVSMEVLAAQRYSEAYRSPGDLPLFDRDRRLFSEMEICDFSLYLTPPNGYELVRYGLIKTDISGKPDMFNHYYYQEKSTPQNIMCLTFGQFLFPNDTLLNRGDRIRMLLDKERHPQTQLNHQLIQGISPEIYCLSGDRRIIGKTLGLYYC